MTGKVRQFKLLEGECFQPDIYQMMMYDGPNFKQLTHYFTLEEFSYKDQLYDSGWSNTISYQQQTSNAAANFVSTDSLDWPLLTSTYAYYGKPLFSNLAIASASVNWCVAFHIAGYLNTDVLVLKISNFFSITRLGSTKNYEIKFLTSGSIVYSVPTPDKIQSSWTTIVLTRQPPGYSNGEMYLYTDGVRQLIPNGEDMPAGLADISTASSTQINFVRELKIMQDYCREGFVRSCHNRVQLDGLFYHNIIHYQPNFVHPNFVKVLRIFQMGILIENYYQSTTNSGLIPFTMCPQDQFFDGYTCVSQFIMYFNHLAVYGINLPISKPKDFLGTGTCFDFQLEFFLLLTEDNEIGDLVWLIFNSDPTDDSTNYIALRLNYQEFLVDEFEIDHVSASSIESITVPYGKNEMLQNTNDRYWRKINYRFACLNAIEEIGYDGQWKYQSPTANTILELDFRLFNRINVCYLSCDHSIAHLLLLRGSRNFPNPQDLYKKPGSTDLILAYYPLTSLSNSVNYIYDASGTPSPNRLLARDMTDRKFKWWNIKEIYPYAEPIFMCNTDDTYNFITGRCEPAITSVAKFQIGQPLTHVLTNQNPTLNYFTQDWTLDLWVKYVMLEGQSYLEINFLSTDPNCKINTPQSYFGFYAKRNGYQTKIEFQISDYNSTMPTILTEDRYIYEQSWIHLAVVNQWSGTSQISLFGNCQYPQSQNVAAATFSLPNCDLWLGYVSNPFMLFDDTFFYLKELRIWNEAKSLNALRIQSLMRSFEVGAINLVRYYRFNLHGLSDIIQTPQGHLDFNNLDPVFDNYDPNFNFDCPYGYRFNFMTSMCSQSRDALVVPVNHNQIWKQKDYIQPIDLDQDSSFAIKMSYYSPDNTWIDTFFIDSLLEVFQNSSQYQIVFIQKLVQQSFTFSVPQNQRIDWAIVFSGLERTFKVYANQNLVATCITNRSQINADTTQWAFILGAFLQSRTQVIYALRYAFFIGTLPTNFILSTAALSWSPQLGMTNMQAFQLWETTDFTVSPQHFLPYDFISKDLTTEFMYDGGVKMVFQPHNEVCPPGAFMNDIGTCMLPQSLLNSGGQLLLNAKAFQVGYSMTFQYWYSIRWESGVSMYNCSMNGMVSSRRINQVHYLWVVDLSDNTLLKQQLNVPSTQHVTWYQHTLVKKVKNLEFYHDDQLINYITDPNYSWETKTVSAVGAFASSMGILFKRISLMRYPKSKAEIVRDLTSPLDYITFYSSLRLYYPLQESSGTILYDYSRYTMTSTINNANFYWDYMKVSSLGSNLNSLTSKDVQTRDKALYFQQGLTASITFPPPSNHISNDHTLMFCLSFQKVPTLSGKQTVFVDYPQVFKITLSGVSSSQISMAYYFYHETTAPLSRSETTFYIWKCFVASFMYLEQQAYLINPKDPSSLSNIWVSDSLPSSPATPMSGSLSIGAFNFYLRELRLFSIGMTMGLGISLSRQSLNTNHYWGTRLVQYFRLDEGAGSIILDYSSGLTFQIPSVPSQSIHSPQWSNPGSKLLICEGETKFSSTGYCQQHSKFLKLPNDNTLITTITTPMQLNTTLAMWMFIREFDANDIITISYEHRFTISLGFNKIVKYQVGDYKRVLTLGTQSVIQTNRWFLIFQMHNQEGNLAQCAVVYTVSGNNFNYKSSYVMSAFAFDPINSNGVYLNPGLNSDVYARELLIFGSSLSLDQFMAQRLNIGMDPIAQKQRKLLAYFKFDESAGQAYVTNSALLYRESRVISYHRWPTGRNITWEYESNLDVDPTQTLEATNLNMICRDPYSRRQDNECDYYFSCDPSALDNLCQDPTSANVYSCNVTGDQIFSAETQDCYDCYPACTTCTVASSSTHCTSCIDGYFLFQNQCLTECPQFYYLVNGTCVSCGDPNCICTSDDLLSCIGCLNSSYFYIQDELKCLAQLPDGYYYDYDQQTLAGCHPYCGTCFWYDEYSCYTCSNSTQLIAPNHCYDFRCSDNIEVYESGSPPSCLECQKPCLTCQETPSNCTACDELTVFDDEGQCLACTAILGYKYPIIGEGKNKVCTEICGDGLNLGQYKCDDGNTADGDGCSSQCEVEQNMACEVDPATQKSVCHDAQGPRVDIISISQQSKIIMLKFTDPQGSKIFTNLTALNDSTTTIVITGIDGSLKYSMKSKVSEEFSASGKLSIYFSPKFSIPGAGAYLSVKFSNANYFRDNYANPLQNLITSKHQLEQYEYTEQGLGETIGKIGAAVSSSAQTIIALNFVASIFLEKALDSLYAAINSVQILYYLPLIDLPFPGFVYQSFSFLSYATFENQIIADPISYTTDFSNISDAPLNEAFNNYNIESSLFLSNYKYKLGMLCIIFSFLPIAPLLSRGKCKIFNVFRKMNNFYFFNGSLRLLYELYLEMGLYAFCNLGNLQFGNSDQIKASSVAIVAIALAALFPTLIFAFIQKNSTQFFREDQFAQKYSTLVEGTRRAKNSRLPQFNFPIFLFRRQVYIVILVMLRDYPQLQVVLCVLKTLGQLLYFVVVLPFGSRLANAMNIFNEALTGVAFALCFMLEKNMDEAELNQYGWLVVGITGFILSANMLVALIETALNLIELIQKLVKKAKMLIKKTKETSFTQVLKQQLQPGEQLQKQCTETETNKTQDKLMNDDKDKSSLDMSLANQQQIYDSPLHITRDTQIVPQKNTTFQDTFNLSNGNVSANLNLRIKKKPEFNKQERNTQNQHQAFGDVLAFGTPLRARDQFEKDGSDFWNEMNYPRKMNPQANLKSKQESWNIGQSKVEVQKQEQPNKEKDVWDEDLQIKRKKGRRN